MHFIGFTMPLYLLVFRRGSIKVKKKIPEILPIFIKFRSLKFVKTSFFNNRYEHGLL